MILRNPKDKPKAMIALIFCAVMSAILSIMSCKDEPLTIPQDYSVPCHITTYGAEMWCVNGEMVTQGDTTLPLSYPDTITVETDGYKSTVEIGGNPYLETELNEFSIPIRQIGFNLAYEVIWK